MPLFDYLEYWGGVDIFLCVSGFVITGSLLRRGTPSAFRELAIPFYIRRIFRIWPAAFLWLLVTILAAKFANSSNAFGSARVDIRDGIAAVLQVYNVYLHSCNVKYISHCGQESIYWSLSLEEQFYLIFPLLLYCLDSRKLRWLLAILILIQFPIPRERDNLLWFIRTDALSYGVLIAMAADRGSLRALQDAVSNHPLRARWLAVLLIAMVAALSVTPGLKINVGLLALVSAGLVTMASGNPSVIIPRSHWLRSVFLWGGSRSFGIYLIHLPCFWATREIFYRIHHGPRYENWVGLAVTCAGLILVTSELSYRLVETPLREFGHRLSKRFTEAAAPRSRISSLVRTG